MYIFFSLFFKNSEINFTQVFVNRLSWNTNYFIDTLQKSLLLRVYVKIINLVDSASSHTLVSKIKPCMSKYKYFTVKLQMAHYNSYSLFDNPLLLG